MRRLDPHRRLRLSSPPNPQYSAGGDQALIDGLRGGADFRLGRWQGFSGVELEAELDLGRVMPLHRISTGFLHDQASWIFLPLEVSYQTSVDGHAWQPAGAAAGDVDPHQERPVRRELGVVLASTRARFIRLRTRSLLKCPPWHPGAGGPAHLFADEIAAE